MIRADVRENGLGETLKDRIEVGEIMVGNSDPLTWLDPTRWLHRGEVGQRTNGGADSPLPPPSLPRPR